MGRRPVFCWVCGAGANGVCRFCGRGTCKLHAKTKAYLFESWEDGEALRGLAIEDALYCGVCRPRPDPISLDFLRSRGGEGSSG
jgi:hypothetical protein